MYNKKSRQKVNPTDSISAKWYLQQTNNRDPHSTKPKIEGLGFGNREDFLGSYHPQWISSDYWTIVATCKELDATANDNLLRHRRPKPLIPHTISTTK